MTTQQLQAEVDQWIKEFGVRYFDEKTNTILLMEEMGEFARIVARVYGEQSFKKSEKTEDKEAMLADEWGDMFFVMICLANQLGIDIEATFRNNMLKKTTRDQARHQTNRKLKE